MGKGEFWDDGQLKREILKHLQSERFVFTKHAIEEQENDGIYYQDTLQVLRNGIHEKEKTGFDNKYQVWKYAIRGMTEDSKIVRVIISFNKNMMIITVMKLRNHK